MKRLCLKEPGDHYTHLENGLHGCKLCSECLMTLHDLTRPPWPRNTSIVILSALSLSFLIFSHQSTFALQTIGSMLFSQFHSFFSQPPKLLHDTVHHPPSWLYIITFVTSLYFLAINPVTPYILEKVAITCV
jgi:hypothetical protein